MQARFFLFLVLLTGGVYLNALGNPFIWDDSFYISNNPHLQSAQYIPEYFMDSFCKGAATDCAFYRPLVALSYLVDYQVWGNNPVGFHLTNVLIHILVVLLLYGVTLRLFQMPRVSLIASLVFSVHPVHVESVAFAAARADPLVVLFVLGSLYFFHRFLLGTPQGFYLLLASLITYGLGLLTKEIAITLPLLLLLYDLLFVRHWKGVGELFSRWRSYLPYGAVMILYFIARQGALGFGLTQDLKWDEFWLRLVTAPVLIWDYFRLQVVPYPLMIFHGEPQLFGSTGAAIIWGSLFLGGYLFLLFRVGRYSKGILFGGLWFVVALLPVLNLVPIPRPMVWERFLYLPSVGFAWVLGFLGNLVMERARGGQWEWVRKGLVGGFVGVLALFSVMTLMRNRVWSDEILLWEDTVQKTPRFALAHSNLGLAYYHRGAWDRAAQSYREALNIEPSHPESLQNLGALYQDMGQIDQALNHYDRLVHEGKASPSTYYNMGLIYQRKGELDRAVLAFQDALKENPNFYKARIRLGRLLVGFGKTEEALQEYQEAIAFYPKKPMAYISLAELLYSLGRFPEAEEAYQRFLEYTPPEQKGAREYRLAEERLEEIHRQPNTTE